jgi:hypothetical protein
MLSGRRLITVMGTLALLGLGVGAAPRHADARVAAAAARPPALSAAGQALVVKLKQRYPHATIQINRMGNSAQMYALYVNLVAQPGATLSSGAGALVLSWYLHAYPKQPIYALYSYERGKDGIGFWESEFVPSAKVLRLYRFSFAVNKTYPWTSWHLSLADVQHAAAAGAWPRGVTHAPPRPAVPAKKK